MGRHRVFFDIRHPHYIEPATALSVVHQVEGQRRPQEVANARIEDEIEGLSEFAQRGEWVRE